MKKQQANSVLENDSGGAQQSKQKQQMAGSIGPGGVVIGVGRGQLFPARLALALGMAKTLLGVLLVAFGALALWEQASMSYLGSGLWTGAVVVLSGLMGIMAGQKRTNLIYIVAYLLMSVLALAAIGLLLIFAATGLARDTDAPHGYFVDQEEGSRVEFLGTVPLKQRAIIINAVLVALGTLSTFLSLAAVVICLREACLCYGAQATTAGQHRRLVNSNSSCTSSHHHKIGANRIGSVPNMNLLTADQSPEGQARAYRLLRWLRQSHQHQQQQQQQQQQQRRPPPLLRRLYNPQVPMVAHPIPVAISTTPAASGHPPVGFPSFVTGAPTAYVIPAGAMPVLQPMISGPAFYSLTSLSSLHHHHHAPGMPPPPTHMHHPANYVHREMVSLPVATAGATPSERNHKKEKKRDKSAADEKRCRRSRSTVQANDQPEMKEQNKRDRSQQRQHFFGMLPSSSTMAKQPQQLTQQPLQSDVESMVSGYVYTGMDRDIAEEFILHSMTIPTPATQASSVKSGFSTNQREVF